MGDEAQNWLILRNGSVTIGLFQGGLPRNTLTFNPGWDEKGKGPAGFLLTDPDGNPVLIDQHR